MGAAFRDDHNEFFIKNALIFISEIQKNNLGGYNYESKKGNNPRSGYGHKSASRVKGSSEGNAQHS